MKKRICALLLAAVLVYMPYALAAAILTPLNHPAAQGTAWAAYEQEAAAQTPGAHHSVCRCPKRYLQSLWL